MRLVYVFLVLVVAGCSPLRYLEPFNGYHGKPVKVETEYYNARQRQGVITYEMTTREVVSFDKVGRIREHLLYSDSGKVIGSRRYTYNRAGNILERSYYDGQNKLDVRNRYAYNRHGQEVRREYLSANRRVNTTTTYDRRNRIAYIEGFVNDTVFHERVKVWHNDQWQRVESRIYDKEGREKTRILTKYNEQGYESGSFWYQPVDKLHSFHQVGYNGNGHRLYATNYAVRGVDTVLTGRGDYAYRYDEAGNIIYKENLSRGLLHSYEKISYVYGGRK